MKKQINSLSELYNFFQEGWEKCLTRNNFIACDKCKNMATRITTLNLSEAKAYCEEHCDEK